eukprot:CAMPEP_0172162670 /NCGR_PEP_ID=MMETSP1050-20130122/6809_1 /TAXON_ID=233186 /ORGANISM="Cryptomonas curvata, Strain CCAP979/52" /LENGTH=98 /DNA_ID=CAMNT_0012832703 /DNA_START=256 /DNA_END=549 /DNA_ORIENTATION=+
MTLGTPLYILRTHDCAFKRQRQTGNGPSGRSAVKKLGQLFESSGNIKVYIRVRPPNDSESRDDVISYPARDTLALSTGETFTFDHVAGPSSTQADMFK